MGFVAVNWVGDHGAQRGHTFSVADRQLVLQLVGFGYFITPHVRVMLSVQFVELVAGLWTALGAGLPLGRGFAVGLAVQMPLMLLVRSAFTVAPAAFVSSRF